jgi:transposase
MSGPFCLTATAEERSALEALSRSSDRGEADRARALLLSLDGHTSAAIGATLRTRADSVRRWRSWFATGRVAALRSRPRSGRPPVRGTAALACAEAILADPGRTVWTLPRLKAEIARRTGVAISVSRLSVLLRKKGASPGAVPGTR